VVPRFADIGIDGVQLFGGSGAVFGSPKPRASI